MPPRRRFTKPDSDGFFSLKENPKGASVGNFVSNMKKMAEIPGKIKNAVTAPAPKRRMRVRRTY